MFSLPFISSSAQDLQELQWWFSIQCKGLRMEHSLGPAELDYLYYPGGAGGCQGPYDAENLIQFAS